MRGPAAAFYYDFSSPYSYLAAERISGLFAEAGVEAQWQPISFGHILKVTGRRPWSFEEDKGADFAEIQRRADERGIPEVVYPEGCRSEVQASTRPGRGLREGVSVGSSRSPSPASARCSPLAGT